MTSSSGTLRPTTRQQQHLVAPSRVVVYSTDTGEAGDGTTVYVDPLQVHVATCPDGSYDLHAHSRLIKARHAWTSNRGLV